MEFRSDKTDRHAMSKTSQVITSRLGTGKQMMHGTVAHSHRRNFGGMGAYAP